MFLIRSDLAGLFDKQARAELANLIINPRTSKPISKETLQHAFADELKIAIARRKAIIVQRFIERINAGDAWAIRFGLRHINGWRDDEEIRHPVGCEGEMFRLAFVGG
jgi:hypothetical protein